MRYLSEKKVDFCTLRFCIAVLSILHKDLYSQERMQLMLAWLVGTPIPKSPNRYSRQTERRDLEKSVFALQIT